MPSMGVNLPSFSMTMHCAITPALVILASIAFTLPEQEEMILAETKPSALAMICPARTGSFFFTTGMAGFPMC